MSLMVCGFVIGGFIVPVILCQRMGNAGNETFAVLDLFSNQAKVKI